MSKATLIQKELGAKTATNDKYNFEQHIYPESLDVATAPYVSIRINVLQGSAFYTKDTPTVKPNRGTARLISGATDTTAQLAGTAAILGGTAGGALSSIFTGSGIQALKAAAKGAAIGAVAATTVTTTTKGMSGDPISTAGRYVRLKDEIVLNMPNSIEFGYGVVWRDESTSEFNMANATVHALGNAPTEASKILKDAKAGMAGIKNIVKEITNPNTATQLAGALALRAGGSGLSAATNTAFNPHEEQIFESVKFREFTYNWNFSPKNESEASNVLSIIKLLRFHAAPEYNSANQFTYIYPSQFELRFFVGSEENRSIPKIATCVISDIVVNYTPHEVFAILADGGIPFIKMSVSFSEIVMHTKETISLGY